MQQQRTVEEHEAEDTVGDEERDGRGRIALRGEVERLREQIEERNAENGPRAEAEDEMETVASNERERSAEHGCGEGRTAKDECHARASRR
jgi:hypothetical protein